MISLINLLVKGCNVRSKAENIERIFRTFGRCSVEYTLSTDEIMVYFEDERDLQCLLNSKDSILEKIGDLFKDKFRASKGPVFLHRISNRKLGLSKFQISLQGEEIYDILRSYGPCKITDELSQNEFIVEFLGSEDLDDLMQDKEKILNKIQEIFI